MQNDIHDSIDATEQSERAKYERNQIEEQKDDATPIEERGAPWNNPLIDNSNDVKRPNYPPPLTQQQLEDLDRYPF